jgi:hypothetical protein
VTVRCRRAISIYGPHLLQQSIVLGLQVCCRRLELCEAPQQQLGLVLQGCLLRLHRGHTALAASGGVGVVCASQ